MSISAGMRHIRTIDHPSYRTQLFGLPMLLFVIITAINLSCQSDEGQVITEQRESTESSPEDRVLTDSLFAAFGFPISNEYGASLLFDSIGNQEYSRLVSSRYSTPVAKDSAGLMANRDSHIIYTAYARLKYPGSISESRDPQPDHPYTYTTYHGKVPGAGFYIVSHWHSGSILTGSMSLIDSISNTSYSLGSVSDGAADEVLAAPNGDFYVYFSNAYNESGIGILSYQSDTLPVLRQISSFRLRGLIEEAFWTTDNRIVFKVNHRQRSKNWQDEYYYLASKPLHFSWYTYRNEQGDSLEAIGLSEYLRYPLVLPHDSIRFLKPVITNSSKEDYQTASSLDLAPVDTTGLQVQSRKHDFLIRTADSLYIFPETSTGHRSRWYSIYRGYHPDLKLYEVYLVDGTNAIGQMILIDSLSNKVLKPVSPFDAGLYNLKFSADGKYLTAISNSIYDPGSYLVLWRIKWSENGVLGLQYLISYEMPEWNLRDYKWVAPGKFLLKTTQDLHASEEEAVNDFRTLEVDLP